MPTGDTRVELALKRFLSQNRLSSNFMDYLRTEYLDLGARIFPESGLFTYPVTITPNWGGNTFTLTPDPVEGIDNAGHVLQLEDAAHRTNIAFANVGGVHYWVGLRYIEIVSGVYANPRSGVAEYDLNMNEVGEKDVPDSVTDNLDGTITFVINTITQSGYSHAGRSVKVWLKNPLSIDATVAIETRTSTYAAPNNEIRTVGALGQSVISVDPNDYYVALIGPTVHGQPLAAPMPFGDEYIVLGYIVGGAPGSVSTVDQVDLSGGGGHTLQKAYDGLSGSGSGRTVSVQDESIQLRQESVTYRDADIMNSALRIRKDIPTTLHDGGFLAEGGIDVATRFQAAHSFVGRSALHDMTGSDELRVEEAVSITNVDEITFTRVGVDLTLGSSTYSVIRAGDLVEISGSALGQDGVYTILAVAGTSLTCLEYSSAVAPGWANELGLTARIFRPVVSLNRNSHAISIRPLSDFYREFYAIAMPSGQLAFIMPDNTHDDEYVIKADRSADYFYVKANGDVQISGKLDILAGLTDGIEMNGRSLDMGGGHITAALTISATGDIRSDDDIIADHDASGAGDFKYGLAKPYTLHLSASDCQYVQGNFVYHVGGAPGGANCYSWIEGAGAGTEWYAVIPVHLPEGAVVTEIRYKVYDNVVGGDCVYCSFTRYSFNMGAAAAPNARTLVAGSAEVGSTSIGWETLTDNLAPDHTIDGGYHYEIFIRVNAGSANLKFAAVEVDYSISTINAGPN